MANGTADLRSRLEKNLKNRIAFAWGRAVIWSWLYHLGRVLIIVLSAVTAAKAIDQLGKLAEWQGYFALTVAVLTALDSWAKPQLKYRTHYKYDDEYRRLQSQLDLISDNDPELATKLDALREELEKVRQQYRNELFNE
jgi:hypothetical protein